MSVEVEMLEGNMARLTIQIPVEDVEKAMDKVYTKMRRNISVPGFRKGRAPRKIVERMYGPAIFLDDAVQELVPRYYEDSLDEVDLEVTSSPELEVTSANPGEPLVFTATVAVMPDVELGQYKGVEVARVDATISEELVDQEISRERELNGRILPVEDRPSQMGDIVTLDFEGFMDGVPFENGKAENYSLTLGSGTFIAGFEDQLVGYSAGDHPEVHVTFPEDYGSEELAGKEALFQCEIKKVEIKELPDLDDDFAQDVSEFETMVEYRDSVRTRLEEAKMKEVRQQIEEEVLTKLVEECQMDIPDAMVKTQTEQIMQDMSNDLKSQGYTLEQYAAMSGLTPDNMKEMMKGRAENEIRVRLILEKIAEVENLTPTEEEVEARTAEMAAAAHMDVEKYKESLTKKQSELIVRELAVEMAEDLIVDEAVQV